MPRAGPRAASRIAVVGPERVGKRSLALALGAEPGRADHSSSGDGDAFSWHASRTTLRILRDRRQLAAYARGSESSGAEGDHAAVVIVLVVFDLTRKESFEAALAQWSLAAHGDASSHRTLLVGTKLDLAHEREVFRVEASQVAEMQFSAYVEVSATQQPFTGVDEIQRLLGEWTGRSSPLPISPSQDTQDSNAGVMQTQFEQQPGGGRTMRASSCDSAIAPSIQSEEPENRRHASPKRQPCIRASVWLYDPTEDHPPSPEHDVKLRPISRALFEIRGAGQDKMKSIAKYKDREVSKFMQRSKYYGPTESSRHMRWQEQQKEKMRQSGLSSLSASFVHVRPRSASQGANTVRGYDRHREHELLDTKSFAQTTELLRQRKLELMAKKALLAAGATSHSSRSRSASHTRSLANPQAARDSAQQQKRTKKHAATGTKLSSVPEEERGACEVATLGTLAPVQTRSELSIDTEAPVAPVAAAMDLILPGADHDAALPTPLPIAYLQSPIPPVMSPLPFARNKQRASSFSQVPSTATAFALDCSSPVRGADARDADRTDAGAAAAWENEICDDADGATDGEDVSDDRAFRSEAQQLKSEESSATTKADDAFDSFDIDDMLDYFDGVSLPL